ncbi:MAG TPA: hypothetical protein VNJ04_05460 [Gemmatimonadaceae bacterium]|nr:hypothetical protein [Gemmatimonadaceae bacterium]
MKLAAFRLSDELIASLQERRTDLLTECERLCRERQGSTCAGWQFLDLFVELYPSDDGDCLFVYTRVRGTQQAGRVTCALSLEELHRLLKDPHGLMEFIPPAERIAPATARRQAAQGHHDGLVR